MSSQNSCYPNAASPCKVGFVTLPNRIVFPAWQVNYANLDGTINDKLIKFYTDLAEGGAGLVIVGNVSVTDDGIPFDRIIRADKEECTDGLTTLFSAIQGHGSVAGVQLTHFGRQSSSSFSGDTLMAPSAIPCPVMSQLDPNYEVRAMTLTDIERVRQGYFDTAERCAEAGAEVIEVHAGHGYLLNEFLSPFSNKREDAYGGGVEDRARLTVEIIEGIRQRLGDEIAISVRVSGDEFVEGGLKPADFEAIVPLFEDAGMDMLNVSAGVYASMERVVPPPSLGETPHVPIAETIKGFTDVPVCAVGSIFSVATAEEILASGKADLCAMGRAQMADPAIVRKSLNGQEDQITDCMKCNACTFWTTGDPYTYCMANPDYQPE
jgi:2,4-dienoyl-CoA reductase-like NADH-dependent reductase (Old Yellow Enzyme family)